MSDLIYEAPLKITKSNLSFQVNLWMFNCEDHDHIYTGSHKEDEISLGKSRTIKVASWKYQEESMLWHHVGSLIVEIEWDSEKSR